MARARGALESGGEIALREHGHRASSRFLVMPAGSMTIPLDPLRRAGGCLLLFCAFLSGAQGAEPTRNFEIPAGEAGPTLKHFALQAAREMVFSPTGVAGVTTNAIRGSLTAREALDQMLRDTGLVASQERKSGAFAVRRADRQGKNPGASLVTPMRDLFRTSAGQTGTITGRIKNLVAGQYLYRARIALKGTDQVAYTDEAGSYRLGGVRAGRVVVEIFYTDLDPVQHTVEVLAGGNTVHSVELTSRARYGEDPEVVKLNPFVLAADKEADANAVATNEQRFAPNIKNVVSTDSLGDVLGSNVGEFLKFIPGLSAEYSSSEIVGINIRGITGDMTTFSADGAPQVNANSSANRTYNLVAMALNDIARIEVTKVPLPSRPADSLAGSVNVISKSASDRDRAQLRYRVTLTGNSENLYWKPMPDSNADANKHKIVPGATFDYTLPLNRDLGVVITGMQSTSVNEQNFSTTNYTTSGTGTGASITRPFLLQHMQGDGPSRFTKRTLKVKADWRVAPTAVLSASYQFNDFKSSIGSLNMSSTVGANGTPAVAGGTSLDFGPDYAIGASGRGGVNISGSGQSYFLKTRAVA